MAWSCANKGALHFMQFKTLKSARVGKQHSKRNLADCETDPKNNYRDYGETDS